MNSKKTLVASIALALAATAAVAGQDSTVVVESFHSATLNRAYEYAVYLPNGYADNKNTAQYPVVYLLHGANGFATEWLQADRGDVKPTLDKLIAECKIPPMVAIMPGHTAGWWVDGTKEKAETPFFAELKPLVEQKYRIRTDRDGVMIGGDSAGGYAAARWALKYPHLFGAAAPLSPAIYLDSPPLDSSSRRQGQYHINGVFNTALWQSHNYPTLLAAYKAQPLRVPMYVNSGDDDKFLILPEANDFYDTMRAIQKGKVELRVVNGDHVWDVWRSTIGDALQYMSKYVTNAPEPGHVCPPDSKPDKNEPQFIDGEH